MRHEARLDQLANDGKSQRIHLESAAKRGHPAAMAALAGPDVPVCVEYLHTWAQELHGRSGVGMNGAAPLSYSTLADWSHLKGVTLEPHEVESLLILDAYMSAPGEPDGAD